MNWVCVICGEPADYRTMSRCFCDQHWNYGEPKDEVLDCDTDEGEPVGTKRYP